MPTARYITFSAKPKSEDDSNDSFYIVTLDTANNVYFYLSARHNKPLPVKYELIPSTNTNSSFRLLGDVVINKLPQIMFNFEIPTPFVAQIFSFILGCNGKWILKHYWVSGMISYEHYTALGVCVCGNCKGKGAADMWAR